MLPASRTRILELLVEEDLVLDVGGGASPFERADWVIDLLSYPERARYGPPADPGRERFGPETWIERDICARTSWPFADRQFDFAVCSHTLEDVRDPLHVCGELIRVAKAGYIEVPSRLEEQSFGVQGPWVGWSHHRWLIDMAPDELTFVAKPHVIHARSSDQFAPGFVDTLSPDERVSCLWWRDRFAYRERIFLESDGLDRYLAEFVAEHQAPPRRRPRLRRR